MEAHEHLSWTENTASLCEPSSTRLAWSCHGAQHWLGACMAPAQAPLYSRETPALT